MSPSDHKNQFTPARRRSPLSCVVFLRQAEGIVQLLCLIVMMLAGHGATAADNSSHPPKTEPHINFRLNPYGFYSGERRFVLELRPFRYVTIAGTYSSLFQRIDATRASNNNATPRSVAGEERGGGIFWYWLRPALTDGPYFELTLLQRRDIVEGGRGRMAAEPGTDPQKRTIDSRALRTMLGIHEMLFAGINLNFAAGALAITTESKSTAADLANLPRTENRAPLRNLIYGVVEFSLGLAF